VKYRVRVEATHFVSIPHMARKPLLVQEKAHALLVQVDRAANRIRGSQHAQLRKQLFNSALSIVSNIGEGREKGADREFLRFLGIARGSAGELEEQIRSATDLCLIPTAESADLDNRSAEVAKMLRGLVNKIRRDLGLDDEDERPDAEKSDNEPTEC